MSASTLDAFLASQDRSDPQLADVVRALAAASVRLRSAISQGLPEGSHAESQARTNPGGDVQKALDLHADQLFLDAMRQAPVALYASEEQASAVRLDPRARLAVAIDPLDGSSNIDTNLSIGTIFAILPVAEGDVDASFLQPGSRQLAAGFFVYGPQLTLALTLGAGTTLFSFSSRLGTFVEARPGCSLPERTEEFAINASNYRHWDEAVRLYVDDCLKGKEGPREKNFNMRWLASLAGEAQRILTRGGVFLYPADSRPGRADGLLRLVYEANPIAMLIEQAGGGATDTVGRILDIVPSDLHQRVPLVFGSAREVARIARYHTEPSAIGERSPLFGRRSLFRT